MRNGTNITATPRDTPKANRTVQGKAFTKSLICPVREIKNGKKVIPIASVADKTALKYSPALSIAASFLGMPSSIFSKYPSKITIELSTIIPRTTMRAANVTVLSSIPKANINAKVINILIGIVEPATAATLIGINAKVTKTTAKIAIPSSFKNV